MVVFLLTCQYDRCIDSCPAEDLSVISTIKTCFRDVQSTQKHLEENWNSLNVKSTKTILHTISSCRQCFFLLQAYFETLNGTLHDTFLTDLFNCKTTCLLSAKCGNCCCLCLLFENNTITMKLLLPLADKDLFDITTDWILKQQQQKGQGNRGGQSAAGGQHHQRVNEVSEGCLPGGKERDGEWCCRGPCDHCSLSLRCLSSHQAAAFHTKLVL